MALQRLDQADATLVTSLESLTNMKHHLANTTKTVVNGFSEHAKTLAKIKNGLSSQTTALAALEARLRTHSGLLDQLSQTSEAQSTRLDVVMARVDSTADTLRDDIAVVRARLIPDLRSEVKALDATLHVALARLPPTDNPVQEPASNSPTAQDASYSATMADTTTATDGTSSTSDNRKTATNGTWYQDVSNGAPADGNTATDGTSSGSEDKKAAPGGTSTTSAAPHNVRFGVARDLRNGQAPQSSFGDSRFGPTCSFISPSRSDDSWYRPGHRVPHVTPGPDGNPFNDGSHHVHPRDQRPPRLSTSNGDPTLGGSFRYSNVDPTLGGPFRKIISPRVDDREKIARDRQLRPIPWRFGWRRGAHHQFPSQVWIQLFRVGSPRGRSPVLS